MNSISEVTLTRGEAIALTASPHLNILRIVIDNPVAGYAEVYETAVKRWKGKPATVDLLVEYAARYWRGVGRDAVYSLDPTAGSSLECAIAKSEHLTGEGVLEMASSNYYGNHNKLPRYLLDRFDLVTPAMIQGFVDGDYRTGVNLARVLCASDGVNPELIRPFFKKRFSFTVIDMGYPAAQLFADDIPALVDDILETGAELGNIPARGTMLYAVESGSLPVEKVSAILLKNHPSAKFLLERLNDDQLNPRVKEAVDHIVGCDIYSIPAMYRTALLEAQYDTPTEESAAL